MLNIAVLVSGGGTNLQALLDSEARGENPDGKITLVVASKPGVYALERAAKAGVEGVVVRRKDYATSEAFDAALLKTLKEHDIDLEMCIRDRRSRQHPCPLSLLRRQLSQRESL